MRGGNTLTNDNTTSVTFAKSGGAGTVTGLGSDTATAGVASVTVTGALAGSIDIDATASAVTSNTLTFAVVPGAASQIVLSGSTTNLTSGATRVLTATIEDAAGNVRTSDTPVVTFSKTGGAGTVTGLGADTAVAGVGLRDRHRGPRPAASTSMRRGASLTSNTLTFTIVPGAATQLVLSGATTNLTSGATRILTATLEDAAGNAAHRRQLDRRDLLQDGRRGHRDRARHRHGGGRRGLGHRDRRARRAASTSMATAGPLTSNTLTFTVVVGAASQIVLTGAHVEPDLRRDARPDRDHRGCGRQRPDGRQHGRHVRQDRRRGHRDRPRQRCRQCRRGPGDRHRRPRREHRHRCHRRRPRPATP